ncbi:hypothetical protein H2279_07010, partial [Campylobacter sp. B0100352/1]|uniref:Cj0814 family flagellar-dependent secreted protein n=1 Tax=Campylobacter sp. B0100352/1 TaxID=2735783 RepID=UPI001E18E203|nr:hypothetical protein [Campylobacter sp. B0100352/1]
MINSINSYSNYNYYTNTLNSKKNSKTNDSVDNNKEINNNTNLNNHNNNNNISNNTSLKQTQETNSNLVNDKSKAVNKILGYGVDEDGFFTSDFNEAAGIPKDYKIYAKDMESFVNFEESDDYLFSFFNKIDIAKTIGNVYKILSQLMPQTSNSSLSKEELESIPYAFGVDDNLNVIKTYTYEEWKNNIDKINDAALTFNTTKKDFGNGYGYVPIDANSIFNLYSIDNAKAYIDKTHYIDNDGNVSKGGVLMAFLNEGGLSYLEGETKLIGKLIGRDKNVNEAQINDFQNFMNKNKIQSAFYKDSSSPDIWNPIEEQLSMQLYIKRSQ